jgi:hypothetical protein
MSENLPESVIPATQVIGKRIGYGIQKKED